MLDYQSASKVIKRAGRYFSPEALKHRVVRARVRALRSMENLETARREPDFASTRELVRAAGTDSIGHFGNGYTLEGGLHLQQNPDEFAALCLALKKQKPIQTYLEIGSGSGGSCRFLYEQVGFGRVVALDDGCHARAKEQPNNMSGIPNLTRFVGDSHSAEARRFLVDNLRETVDVAFVDGDHSYEGVWADIRLVLAFSKPGTVFVFHDTIACDGVERAWLDVVKGGLVSPIAEYIGKEKPLGIAVGVVR